MLKKINFNKILFIIFFIILVIIIISFLCIKNIIKNEKEKDNLNLSRIEVQNLIQTCVDSKISIDSSSVLSTKCSNGYIKKKELKSSTCNEVGDFCEENISSTCKKEWYYTCHPIHTIVNVPIDSRPITRSNFEYLVNAAGFGYKEIAIGLDKNNDYYENGDYNKVINETKNVVSKINNENTTVIINTSSYLFGGLMNSRGINAYQSINQKISSLTSLLTMYSDVKYYVTFIIPRTKPEERVINVYGLYHDKPVSGLQCFYEMENGVSQKDCSKTTFKMATMEWAYLKSLQKHNIKVWNQIPAYVKKFYTNFEDIYTGDFALYKENGISAPELYENVFINSDLYLNSLLSLKKNGYIDELIIGIDDFEIPEYLKCGSDTSWVPKDSFGNIIKYGFAYDLYKKTSEIENDDLNFFGADEINYLILAREVIRKKEKKVNFNYNVLKTMYEIQTYDRNNSIDTIERYINFINEYGDLNYKKSILIEFVNSTNCSNKSFLKSIKNKINDSSKNLFLLQVDSGPFCKNVALSLNDNDKSIFQIPVISGWNTFGNALGIGLSRSIVYTDLDEELGTEDISPELKTRLINYIKTQIIAVLEDSIYNSNKSIANLNLEGNSVLNNHINFNFTFNIGKYNYSINGVSFKAFNPWNRYFEVHITPHIDSIDVSVIED